MGYGHKPCPLPWQAAGPRAALERRLSDAEAQVTAAEAQVTAAEAQVTAAEAQVRHR